MPKVDRSIQKTKAASVSAFYELLKEKDFEQITINAIAERANINCATFYHHYMDKYDLFEKCIDVHLSTLLALCHSIDHNRNEEELRHTFLLIFQYFDDNYHFYSLMLTNKGTHFFQEHFKSIIIRMLAERISSKNTNPLDSDFEIHFMASATVGRIEWWIEKKQAPAWDLFLVI